VSTLRILIVDDHEPIRRRIRSLLASCSAWTVCGEAADGLEAVEKARSLQPDLVLMDVSLPQMDGVEAARIIRRDRPETAVIIVSQNDPKLLARQAAEVGARAHISKSDLGRSLLRTIDKMMDAHATPGNGIEAPAAEAEALPRRPAPGGPAGIKAPQDLAAGPVPAERAIGLLAAIVDSSDDAIISKNLDGIITSWNRSAERIFGYTASEALGQHITLIVPADRRNEEVGILERLRRGERVNHFQTVRTAKDGSRISVSLTISPVRDAAGRVIGASKVARDVTMWKPLPSASRWWRRMARCCTSMRAGCGCLPGTATRR
jgi:PAS domain S-box-containing protein